MSAFKDGARFGGLTILAIVAAFVVMILIASMAIFGWGFFQRSTADFRGETDVIEQTRADAEFRIQSYEWFFDQCAAIQGMEARISAQLTELSADPPPPEDRVSQINTNLAAMRGSRGDLIAKYNQEARKEETTGAFRASNLPASIDPNNEQTTCEWVDELG